ncbi:zinc-dependent metalloprotease [Demetria terragena]|uniref:zinc-dependent metalloprotease n=1 Tax=Demetria terragena TaxID=63959 RepID=UPI0003694F12|nr:zinc-dependent metalloprotease [Demetria terragena]
MSDQPLQPRSGGDDEPSLEEMLRAMLGGEGDDPELADALRQMGLDQIDPATLGMVQAQMQAMMARPVDGPFDVAMATDVARKTVAAEGDPSVSENTVKDVEQVVSVANLWLDEVTDLAAPSASAQAWSRSEWVEQTMPVWKKLVDPVASGVGNAIRGAMQQQMSQLGDQELPPELGLPPGFDLSQMMGQMEPMMERMSAGMFGMQVGQAVGALAGDLVTGTEVGLPLIEDHAVVILPSNVSAFAEGLGIDAGEVHLYLAAREAARARLFARVPWIAPALIAAVQSYAADINIDTDQIERAVGEVNMSDPAELQKALQGSLFAPEPSESQRRAVLQLERLLALVEGWVEVVANRACEPHLPHVGALAESVRRRRAAGGPAERLFASLVGLELRPRRLRDAATLWTSLEEATDAAGRDAAWQHPDHAPTADDLEDPAAYVARRTGGTVEPERDDMDDALDALLSQGRAELDAENPADKKPEDEEPDAGSDEDGPTDSNR